MSKLRHVYDIDVNDMDILVEKPRKQDVFVGASRDGFTAFLTRKYPYHLPSTLNHPIKCQQRLIQIYTPITKHSP